jgi:hypothetical protein
LKIVHILNIKKIYKKIIKSKFCSIISFRYNVIGGLNPNEQEDIYNKVALDIFNSNIYNVELLRPIYVKDSDFEQSFISKSFKRTNRNHKIVKYILGNIERKIFTNDIAYESDIFTIEHILPESADENWGEFTDEEINRSIFRLGNLALLEKNLNRDVGSLNFELKKEVFLKSNSKFTIKVSEDFETWNESKLISRQKEMAKYAKSIWKIQLLE